MSDDGMPARLLGTTRVVRYAELRPCFHAFVDTRTPGSEAKENFTIIGPGVSENPAQHVHISEPHGFNVGGARQPPGCVNSQHSHETAEVFVVLSGRWRFDLGEHGEDAQVLLGPGDLISLPTGVFRGFTNVGDDIGFLWAVLGEDDPGRVTWAPEVFKLAKDHGLILMENGLLVDTAAGERPPPHLKPLPPTTPAQAAAMKRLTQEQAAAIIVRAADEADNPAILVIGAGGKLSWPHGFDVARYNLQSGASSRRRQMDDKVVLFVQEGSALVESNESSTLLLLGDTMTIACGQAWKLASTNGARVYAVSRSPLA